MSWLNRNKYIVGSAIAVALIGFFLYKAFSKNKLGGIALKNKSPKKILFVGDSISVIVDNNGNKVTSTYPNYVAAELAKTGGTVDVLAKGGQTTRWMLQNLPSKLGNKFDRVYIYGGVNDAWNTSVKPEEPFNNVQQMVDLINQSGADAYVIIGYEPEGFMDYKIMGVSRYQTSKEDNIPLIAEYKNYQKELPKRIKNANFVPKVNLGNRTKDGIHPNWEGQKLLANAIINTLN